MYHCYGVNSYGWKPLNPTSNRYYCHVPINCYKLITNCYEQYTDMDRSSSADISHVADVQQQSAQPTTNYCSQAEWPEPINGCVTQNKLIGLRLSRRAFHFKKLLIKFCFKEFACYWVWRMHMEHYMHRLFLIHLWQQQAYCQ